MTEQQEQERLCPKCQGPMWDNREGKRNPRAPDFKCKDRACDGVIWPSRDGAAKPAEGSATPAAPRAAAAKGGAVDADGMPLCPICGSAMWDDRLSKRNPRAPDFKCRNKPKERGGPGCEGVIWPARDGSPSPYPPTIPRAPRAQSSGASAPAPWDREPGMGEAPPLHDGPPPDDDDIPF